MLIFFLLKIFNTYLKFIHFCQAQQEKSEYVKHVDTNENNRKKEKR